MERITVNLLRALGVCLAFNVHPLTALAQYTSWTVLTITNPTPAYEDHFGSAVAAVGNDRVLIGASLDNTSANDAGAAYLFSTNGALLSTFTNPTPAASDMFGSSVAAVGSDRVLISALLDDTGATNAGAAYLFTTNGILLMTFTNPTPAAGDGFGNSVAAMGNDRVLIGARGDDAGPSDAGAAYLFSTGGVLFTTFTNPTPAANDYFGNAVAAVGSDRVLIGAYRDNTGANDAGAAYLFSANGLLLTTFTNPTPEAPDYFGYSVAAVGSDRVLIGAPYDDTLAGAAYLFSTNGLLLTTFTNPTPAFFDDFGYSVAAVGSERVLIGADRDDAGAGPAGSAYLFNTSGALLTTFTNPTPAADDSFGYSVAAVGSDHVLIGAYGDRTAPSFSGAAYLFSPAGQTSDAPSLAIRFTTTNAVAVSWPSPSTGWTLQENTNGVSSVNWSNSPGSIQDDATNKTLIVNPPTGNRFYRLFKP